MRFLGSLAGRMMGDLDATVEAEEDRFLRDGFVGDAGRSEDAPLVRGIRATKTRPKTENATKP